MGAIHAVLTSQSYAEAVRWSENYLPASSLPFCFRLILWFPGNRYVLQKNHSCWRLQLFTVPIHRSPGGSQGRAGGYPQGLDTPHQQRPDCPPAGHQGHSVDWRMQYLVLQRLQVREWMGTSWYPRSEPIWTPSQWSEPNLNCPTTSSQSFLSFFHGGFSWFILTFWFYGPLPGLFSRVVGKQTMQD